MRCPKLSKKFIRFLNHSFSSCLVFGLDNTAHILVIRNSDLHLGGFFYLAGYQPVQNIAKWVLP